MARDKSEEESARQDMMGFEISIFGRQLGSSRVTGVMIPLTLGRFSIKVPHLPSDERSGRGVSTLPHASPSQLSVQAPNIGCVLSGC